MLNINKIDVFNNIIKNIEYTIGTSKLKNINKVQMHQLLFLIATTGDSRIKLAHLNSLEEDTGLDLLSIFNNFSSKSYGIVETDIYYAYYKDIYNMYYKLDAEHCIKDPRISINKVNEKLYERIQLAIKRLLILSPKIFELDTTDLMTIVHKWCKGRILTVIDIKDLITSGKYYFLK